MKAVFKDRAEITDYISGDKIKCLECGKWFKGIGRHTFSSHNMSAREYKIKYGIPIRTPLFGSETVAIMSQNAQARIARGCNNIEKMHEAIAGDPTKRSSFTAPRRGRLAPFLRAELAQQVAVLRAPRIISADICREFLRRMEQGRLICEVETDADMPSAPVLYRYMAKDPAFALRWDKAVEENDKSRGNYGGRRAGNRKK